MYVRYVGGGGKDIISSLVLRIAIMSPFPQKMFYGKGVRANYRKKCDKGSVGQVENIPLTPDSCLDLAYSQSQELYCQDIKIYNNIK